MSVVLVIAVPFPHVWHILGVSIVVLFSRTLPR
jgi:hypothetical protein